MPRLTLRTLLAYIDDTLDPDQARALGRKVAESQEAKLLIERIKKVTRRRGLKVPIPDGTDDDISDLNAVAEYLSDNLNSEQTKELESTCLASDVHLAEVAACHQILTLVLTEPVRVPPSANQRMYRLVESPASDHDRRPGKAVPVGGVVPPSYAHLDGDDPDAALLLGMKRYTAADSWAGRLGLVGAVSVVAVFLAFAVWMALPHAQPTPPDTSRELYSATLGPISPSPVSGNPIAPEPKLDESNKKGVVDPGKIERVDPGVGKKEPVDPKKKDSGLINPVLPPAAGREVIGVLDTSNPMIDAITIVLIRGPEPGSRWERVDEKTAEIRSSDPVMVLPGYKADVRLKSDVVAFVGQRAGTTRNESDGDGVARSIPRSRKVGSTPISPRNGPNLCFHQGKRPVRESASASRVKRGTSHCRTTSRR